MAFIQRVILCIVLGFIPGLSSASFPMQASWQIPVGSSFQEIAGRVFDSYAVACSVFYDYALNDAISKGRTVEDLDIRPFGNTYNCYVKHNLGGAYAVTLNKLTPGCPANSLPDGTNSCTCNAGFNESFANGVYSCKADDICETDFAFAAFGIGEGFGTVRETKSMPGIVPSGTKVCWPYGPPGKGCSVTFNRTGLQQNDDGSWRSLGTFSLGKIGQGPRTEQCDVDIGQTEDGTEVKETCENKGTVTKNGVDYEVCLDKDECEGGYRGEVNGVDVCVPNEGGSEDSEKEELDEDGTKTETKTETKCEKGKCTTTTTTTKTTPGGQATSGTKTTTQDQASFCKENPNSSLCKNGSFGGNCASGFRCEGDAVQCALAQETHKRNCQFWDGVSEQHTGVNIFNDAALKTGKIVDDLPGNVNLDIGSLLSSADQFGLSGGACPAPVVIALPSFMGGSSLDIIFDEICPILEMMGNLIVVLATISGAFIIFRRYG